MSPTDKEYEKILKGLGAEGFWDEFSQDEEDDFDDSQLKTVSSDQIISALKSAGANGLTNEEIIKQYYPEYNPDRISDYTNYQLRWGNAVDKAKRVGDRWVLIGEGIDYREMQKREVGQQLEQWKNAKNTLVNGDRDGYVNFIKSVGGDVNHAMSAPTSEIIEELDEIIGDMEASIGESYAREWDDSDYGIKMEAIDLIEDAKKGGRDWNNLRFKDDGIIAEDILLTSAYTDVPFHKLERTIRELKRERPDLFDSTDKFASWEKPNHSESYSKEDFFQDNWGYYDSEHTGYAGLKAYAEDLIESDPELWEVIKKSKDNDYIASELGLDDMAETSWEQQAEAIRQLRQEKPYLFESYSKEGFDYVTLKRLFVYKRHPSLISDEDKRHLETFGLIDSNGQITPEGTWALKGFDTDDDFGEFGDRGGGRQQQFGDTLYPPQDVWRYSQSRSTIDDYNDAMKDAEQAHARAHKIWNSYQPEIEESYAKETIEYKGVQYKDSAAFYIDVLKALDAGDSERAHKMFEGPEMDQWWVFPNTADEDIRIGMEYELQYERAGEAYGLESEGKDFDEFGDVDKDDIDRNFEKANPFPEAKAPRLGAEGWDDVITLQELMKLREEEEGRIKGAKYNESFDQDAMSNINLGYVDDDDHYGIVDINADRTGISSQTHPQMGDNVIAPQDTEEIRKGYIPNPNAGLDDFKLDRDSKLTKGYGAIRDKKE